MCKHILLIYAIVTSYISSIIHCDQILMLKIFLGMICYDEF